MEFAAADNQSDLSSQSPIQFNEIEARASEGNGRIQERGIAYRGLRLFAAELKWYSSKGVGWEK